MKSTPPESDWTAEDIANQRRVNAEINKALERMYIRMVFSIAVVAARNRQRKHRRKVGEIRMVFSIAVVAALLATAIHFLGKQ